jgi:hypothetical protein
VIVASAQAAAVYEELRTAILSGKPAATTGLGILRRQGLAAWMRALGHEPHAEATCHHAPEPSSSAKPDLSPPAQEVTRLIAGILISLAMESMHA